MKKYDSQAPSRTSADSDRLEEIKALREGFSRFMLNYQFAIDEVMTKINILKTEFEHLHEYSPIEHVDSRLKSPESIVEKIHRRNIPITFDAIREQLNDIAGVRLVCSFIADTYAVAEMIKAQRDITITETKDYIKNPKPNGYKSLHLIVEVPVFLSSSTETVRVEVQIRTIAMDFWASLEHKIYYKFGQEIPSNLLDELSEAADIANDLDVKMERLHNEVQVLRPGAESRSARAAGLPTNFSLDDLFNRE
ncbi:GTP pyrophosphokinase family protein [Brevibacterium sp. ZH18]|uniref:GTP pyrophosphokinase n=1 Tax=Brevibacterium sp. ZH18 TaxID=2927784 RepID=UPI001F621987|nr:GTP pyrophosphokinase family protein [Brevibacterium sp. ZH18]MCI4010362.1 GTP pyrophosphokinase family protein [Brevibacterium sp. ZH18]